MAAKADLLVMTPIHSLILSELGQTFSVTGLARPWPAIIAEPLLGLSPRVRGLVVDGDPVGEALMSLLPSLEVIAQLGVGYDNVDAVAAARRGIVVTHTPGVLDEDVADLCIGLLLAAIREIPQADRHVRAGTFNSGIPYRLTESLGGRTVGLFGLGRIGKAVARRLEGFRVRILYSGRSQQEGVPYEYVGSVLELAGKVDTLICAVPGGAATRQAINGEVLRALGPKGVLVNVGRGSSIDQVALIAALEDGTIHAAGLDVYDNEPNVPERLFAMNNVVLLPHVGSGTAATQDAMARLVVANMVDWFAGRGPRTPVPESAAIL